MQARVLREVDRQPAPKVGVLPDLEPGPAERRAHGLRAFGRRPAEGAEVDHGQQGGPQTARSGVLADGGREPDRVITDLLAAGVEEGAVRDDVGAGAVMMVLQGICTDCDRPGSRDDADGAVTLVLDGLRSRAS